MKCATNSEDTTSIRCSEGSNGTPFLYQGIYSFLLGNFFVNCYRYLFFVIIKNHLNVINLSLPKTVMTKTPWFFAHKIEIFPLDLFPRIFIKLIFVFLWGWCWCNCVNFGGRCGHVTHLLNSFIVCTWVEPFDPTSQRLSQPIHE